MSDFTAIQLIDQFVYADGVDPGPDSWIEFLLTAPMVNTSTGAEVPAAPRNAYLSRAGAMDITLWANDDPTTTPVGTAYKVTKHITGQDPRSYYITLHIANGATQVLGKLPTGDTAPPINYGLSAITLPAPFTVSTTEGTAAVGIDASTASVGDVLTLTSKTPDTLALVTPTGGGGLPTHHHTAAEAHGQVAHADVAGQTANDHHAQSHGHTGADGSGTVAHSALTSVGTDDHHAKSHTHNGDGSGTVPYSALTGTPTIPSPSGTTPLVESGAGAVGSGGYAYGNHVHPAAGGSTGTAPNAVGTLLGWYKADAIPGLSDGDALSSGWADSSGNGGPTLAQATSGKRPIWRQYALNGLGGVQFDGVDDTLTASLALTGAYTMLIVAASFTTSNGYFSDWHGTNYLDMFYEGGNYKVRHLTGSDTTYAVNTVPVYVPQLLGATYDGATVRQYLGATLVQQAAVSAPTVATLHIGSNGDANNYLQGRIYEIALWSTALTPAQWASVVAWERAKWGL